MDLKRIKHYQNESVYELTINFSSIVFERYYGKKNGERINKTRMSQKSLHFLKGPAISIKTFFPALFSNEGTFLFKHTVHLFQTSLHIFLLVWILNKFGQMYMYIEIACTDMCKKAVRLFRRLPLIFMIFLLLA